MKRNVGGIDRIARLLVGSLLVAASATLYFEVLTVAGTLGAGLVAAGLLVGAILLVTGAVGYCPINAALGRDTSHAGDASVAGDASAAGEASVESESPPESVSSLESESPPKSESPPESEVGRAH